MPILGHNDMILGQNGDFWVWRQNDMILGQNDNLRVWGQNAWRITILGKNGTFWKLLIPVKMTFPGMSISKLCKLANYAN